MVVGNPIYDKQGQVYIKEVFFTGSVALLKGQGLCYDRDYGTATVADQRRDRRVELPSTTNNMWFAGVTCEAYDAVSGGQRIRIYEPGSICEVLCSVATTVGVTRMTCGVGAGQPGIFGLQGFGGRGTALALKTAAEGSGVLELSLAADAYLDATGLILTDGSATFITNGVVAGDRVFIQTVESDGTNSGTAGEYVVASVDLETQITLTAAASDGGTMEVGYFVLGKRPLTVLCLLEDGEESGLQQFIDLNDNAASAAMVGGYTYALGGVTLANGNATDTLADGVINGQKKGFKLIAALGTSDWVITVTSGFTMAGGALGTLTLDGAADDVHLIWYGQEWRALTAHGTAES